MCETVLPVRNLHRQKASAPPITAEMGRLSKLDPSSYSQPELLATTHSVLHWNVNFDTTQIKGSVTHHFKVFDRSLKTIVRLFLDFYNLFTQISGLIDYNTLFE